MAKKKETAKLTVKRPSKVPAKSHCTYTPGAGEKAAHNGRKACTAMFTAKDFNEQNYRDCPVCGNTDCVVSDE